MDFKLKTPCANCPFRSDRDGFLRRADEIADGLRSGGTFACHKTTDAVEDECSGSDMVAGERAQMCAGALSVMEKDGGANQIMRIAERIGSYDPTRLKTDAPTFDTLAAFVDHHDLGLRAGETVPAEETSDEPCNVVNAGCQAPAGWGGMGGGVVINENPVSTVICLSCGEATCRSCSRINLDPSLGKGRICGVCEEFETDELDSEDEVLF